MKKKLAHEVLAFYTQFFVRLFRLKNECLQSTQLRILRKLGDSLRGTVQENFREATFNYEQFCSKVPLSTYHDYEKIVEEQQQNGASSLCHEVIRYEPTSGSTYQRKWVPYSKLFLQQMNRAANVWLGDLYKIYPELKTGSHYWSMSWLPEDMRKLTTTNDTELFSAHQRWLLQETMALPAKISQVLHAEAAWWASLILLAACEDLVLVSVWSPTFWLKICEDLQRFWPEIVTNLQTGQWGRHSDELSRVLGPPPRRNIRHLSRIQQLWPRLKLISAWDSSTSRPWAIQLQNLFPGAYFQGKGLWATEAVVTIPFDGKKPLAFQSHFYEFRDLENQRIYPSWQLQRGKTYQPIVSAGSGFLRYQLQDRVELVDFFGQIPCFEFQGRIQSTDMVGEKMDVSFVSELFTKNPAWQAISLIAVRSPFPQYILLHSSQTLIDIEFQLLGFHHYRLARELGQLQPAISFYSSEPLAFLEKLQLNPIRGQNKMEVLLLIESWPEL